MPRFVASVRTPDGTSKQIYVEAGNVATATAILEEQGYRAVAVHNSPEELELDQLNSAFAREQLQKLTPSQAVRARTGGMTVVLQRNWGSLALASPWRTATSPWHMRAKAMPRALTCTPVSRCPCSWPPSTH